MTAIDTGNFLQTEKTSRKEGYNMADAKKWADEEGNEEWVGDSSQNSPSKCSEIVLGGTKVGELSSMMRSSCAHLLERLRTY